MGEVDLAGNNLKVLIKNSRKTYKLLFVNKP